jgi:hypothetical protein
MPRRVWRLGPPRPAGLAPAAPWPRAAAPTKPPPKAAPSRRPRSPRPPGRALDLRRPEPGERPAHRRRGPRPAAAREEDRSSGDLDGPRSQFAVRVRAATAKRCSTTTAIRGPAWRGRQLQPDVGHAVRDAASPCALSAAVEDDPARRRNSPRRRCIVEAATSWDPTAYSEYGLITPPGRRVAAQPRRLHAGVRRRVTRSAGMRCLDDTGPPTSPARTGPDWVRGSAG